MKRWLTLALYAVSLALIYMNKEELIGWMKTGDAPVLLMLALTALLAFFPVVPYSVVIGAMGYMYGPPMGALIALIGAWAAACAMYGAVRYFFRDQGRQRLSRIRKMDAFIAMTERHPFLSILFARLMPIVPQYAVNTYAAVTAIPFWSYAAASFVGKIPGMLVFALIGDNLSGSPLMLAAVAAAYALFLLAALLVYRRLRL
ncbi:TVP38/TMEM64 family protein [Paenibacillus beijingensis]|uniref:TVP38/TMEM64 family membrane protein n=1 Tax=Paenibacillus beijingensis TaxID=1126833 RepID=A0A0D5NKP9_9BACL|nr:VTT domain-containing protein [Paenibacillus beijingensis]AJY75508.1 hypothetical protein VN24_14220 [Paenibacillus beijingensis]